MVVVFLQFGSKFGDKLTNIRVFLIRKGDLFQLGGPLGQPHAPLFQRDFLEVVLDDGLYLFDEFFHSQIMLILTRVLDLAN